MAIIDNLFSLCNLFNIGFASYIKYIGHHRQIWGEFQGSKWAMRLIDDLQCTSRRVRIKTVEPWPFQQKCIIAAHLPPRSELSGAERCWADVLMDREINRGPDQRNLRLRGKKGQRYQMGRNTKSKLNDPTVAHGCLLISQIDFDVMVTKQRPV